MKYLVCSDIHRRLDNFQKALCASLSPDLKGVIIAGDFEVSPSEITDMIYRLCGNVCKPSVYMVKGNCDYKCDLQNELVIRLPGGINCLLTHGHKYNVKMSRDILSYAASSMECQVAIYGHTHLYDDTYIGPTRLINPGCICGGYLGDGGYILMDVDDGIITIQHKILDN